MASVLLFAGLFPNGFSNGFGLNNGSIVREREKKTLASDRAKKISICHKKQFQVLSNGREARLGEEGEGGGNGTSGSSAFYAFEDEEEISRRLDLAFRQLVY